MRNLTISCRHDLEVLRQLLASATHDAAAAMCRGTDGLISLTLDEVRELPLDMVCGELNIDDDLLTMVVLSLVGELGGDMVLIFDDENGRQLAASLLGREVNQDTEWSELEKSALTETGNILACAYMNAVTRLIDHELVPSAPYFVQDFGASVLQQALMAQAVTNDNVLICRTGFHREGEKLNWHVLFVPTDALRQRMGQTLHANA